MNRTLLHASIALGPLLTLAAAQSTTLVSATPNGAPGNNSSATRVCISPDGRFVAFSSFASDLVAGDTNGVSDVFLRDVQTRATERVSVSSTAEEGDQQSQTPALSPDGRFVVFESLSSNLAAGGALNRLDVFRRDRQSGTTSLVSVGLGGATPNHQSLAGGPNSLSADGRYVAFTSSATNLVATPSTAFADVYVRDMTLGTTERISVGLGGAAGNFESNSPAITPDGRFVAFQSQATNLVPGEGPGISYGIYVRDRQTSTTQKVSLPNPGGFTGGNSYGASISADGRFVAFSSLNALVPPDHNDHDDVFVRDLALATTLRASVTNSGGPVFQHSFSASISANGRYVSFVHLGDFLVAGDSNGAADVFVRDLVAGTTELTSRNTAGVPGNGDSSDPAISGDGRFVAFSSNAFNLVPNEITVHKDVFLRDRAVPGSAFCFGDGTGASCPCSNTGAAGAGCANSTGGSGRLAASGSPILSQDTLTLAISGMPNAVAWYFQVIPAAPGAPVRVFGDGLVCAARPVVRLGTTTNATGASSYPGAGEPSISSRGRVLSPGTRVYQVWYRDDAPFCTPARFNLTNAWRTSWTL